MFGGELESESAARHRRLSGSPSIIPILPGRLRLSRKS